jgi:putative membrane protein
MWRMHGAGWWMIPWGIWIVLFWAGLVALVVWVIARLVRRGGHEHGSAGRPDPLEVAKLRYARGEITKEQFDQIKRDLSGT